MLIFTPIIPAPYSVIPAQAGIQGMGAGVTVGRLATNFINLHDLGDGISYHYENRHHVSRNSSPQPLDSDLRRNDGYAKTRAISRAPQGRIER